MDTEGGSLVRSEFLKHVDTEDKSKNILLLEQSKDRIYLAQTGLIPLAGGGSFPTHKTLMTVQPGERSLKDGVNELVMTLESPEQGGVKLVKTYTLTRGSYAIGVKHEVLNQGAAPVSLQVYQQLVRDGN